MGRVVIAEAEQSPSVAFPQLEGVRASGGIKTRAVVSGDDRPIFLWMHELSPGSQISWERPPVGHLAYVWDGDAEANGEMLPTTGVVVVEHGGSAVVRGGPGGTRLLHFHRPESYPEPPARAGGHAHVLGKNGIYRGKNPKSGTSHILWADASCDTCELWLHESANPAGHPQRFPHFHTEDEIIFVTRGGMVIGRRTLKPGTALAIDKETIYSFGRADEGLDFINFRTSNPMYVAVGKKNEPLHDPVSEYGAIRGLITRPDGAKAIPISQE